MLTFSQRHLKLWMLPISVLVLLFALAACGSSSGSTTSSDSGSGASTTSSSSSSSASSASGAATATVFIDEKEGNSNGQDDPAMDKFWFANSKTDQTYTTSYSLSLATGATLTITNNGDDPQKVTFTGPGNYNDVVNVPGGPASVSVKLPTTAGAYTFISDPANTPVRPGARGGTITLA